MNLYKFEQIEINNQHHFNSFIIAIDRLIHHSYLLLFNGESFRYKKSLIQQ